ncbi:MAG: cytidylate kinase family protein, partial [Candidatus Riflebacteria bacterium]|nr:cytidylate kinase family protein [Candidatus Riflebacteria bacterium]
MAILTVSRELGASGTYVALKVADRLGYTCYDQQIINTIAEKMGKEKDQLQH